VENSTDADGVPRSPGRRILGNGRLGRADDGLLVWTEMQGQIDNGLELFGNRTPQQAVAWPAMASLRWPRGTTMRTANRPEMACGPASGVWRDRNGDGLARGRELFSSAVFGITPS